MKILVTGGNDYVGNALIDLLLADGHEVVATARDIAKVKQNIEIKPLDIRNKAACELIAKKVGN